MKDVGSLGDSTLTPYAGEGRGDTSTLKGEVRETEKEIIYAALERNNWLRQKTAEELNINRVTLYNKMKKYGIQRK